MADQTWKQIERKIAKYLTERLGTPFERIPVAMQNKYGFDIVPTTGDIPPYPIGVEAKRRKIVPRVLKSAMDQAKGHEIKHDGYLLPAVILAEHGANENDYIVCMRLEDFTDLIRE